MYRLLYINWKRAENDTTTVFADTAKTTGKYYNNIHGYRLGEEEERMLFFVYAELNVMIKSRYNTKFVKS